MEEKTIAEEQRGGQGRGLGLVLKANCCGLKCKLYLEVELFHKVVTPRTLAHALRHGREEAEYKEERGEVRINSCLQLCVYKEQSASRNKICLSKRNRQHIITSHIRNHS